MSKKVGSKADTAIKMVLIFFISLLSFTVGTLVGGQFEKDKNYQARLENNNEEMNMTSPMASNATHERALSDEEIEGLEEFVQASMNKESSALSTDDQSSVTRLMTKGAVETLKREVASVPRSANIPIAQPATTPAERLAQGQSPTPDPVKKERVPAQALPVVATSVVGKFTVQVASYATETEAKNHATRLRDKGFNSFYMTAEVNGKTWYRVSVGRFEDQKSAMAHRKEILDAQAATTAIVQKILK